jgi:6-phosphogluconolactonase (cycloisomerase 2 family)
MQNLRNKLIATRLFLVGSLCTACLLGQGTFVYTNNDPINAPNSVSAFSVGANGALSPVAGSPFATGGTGLGGGIFAANRITTAIVKDVLYVANGGSNNVSGFSVNPATGVLTQVPGSPFATGGSADGNGIALATTPNDQFLIAANTGSVNITVYSIAANGALSPVAGSPFPAGAGGVTDGIKVTPDGKFLAVARPGSNSVSMFSISGLGGLTPVPGSPFIAGGTGGATGVDCNCNSNHLFIGEANFGSTIVSVQNIALNGALSPVSGSPFIGPGSNSNVVVLNPDDSKLFVSNQVSSTVTAFSVATTGALTLVPGSPFPAPGSIDPSGMATNQAGTFLYTAALNNEINGFSIASTGALTSVPGSPFSNGVPGFGLLSLAVFPPKSCCPAPVITGASAAPNVLWPPNHKFVDVTIDYTVADPCPNTCVLTVSSNEAPVDDKDPEWIVVDAHHVQLRAERLGSGTGRTYTITITCTNDTNKESSTQAVTVLVPHDQGN